MNVETLTLDLVECAQFISFWCDITGAPHITLTAIVPDGSTTTKTFIAADTEKVGKWIARYQGNGRNIYFQVNETPARCATKPSKAMMQLALCRHADVDPVDDRFPYIEEREKLLRLAKFPCTDPTMPPTAILDSGNGIQPLWAVTRELLTPEVVDRAEAENRAVEAAMGAAGTHNIDRLLRLPGTLNFPNARKQKLNRGIGRARLLHHIDATYTIEQGADLGAHLQKLLIGSDLVRFPAEAHEAAEPKKSEKKKRKSKRDHIDRSALALGKGAEMRRQGKSFEEMCVALRADPETAEWCREKGDAVGGRELRRIWTKAGETASEIDRVITEFNAKFMVVNEAGKAVIYHPAEDPILHRRYFNRLGFGDFRQPYMNRLVEVGVTEEGNPIMRPVADMWLHHADRRQFIEGITFDPSDTPAPPGTLNLWQSFAVQPRPSCIPSFCPSAGVGMKESPTAPGFPKRIGQAAISQ